MSFCLLGKTGYEAALNSALQNVKRVQSLLILTLILVEKNEAVSYDSNAVTDCAQTLPDKSTVLV